MNGLRALHSHGNTREAQVTGTMHLDHGFRKVSLMLVLPAKKSVTPGQSCDQSQLALRQPTCASLGCNERRIDLGRKSLERERSTPLGSGTLSLAVDPHIQISNEAQSL